MRPAFHDRIGIAILPVVVALIVAGLGFVAEPITPPAAAVYGLSAGTLTIAGAWLYVAGQAARAVWFDGGRERSRWSKTP